MVRSQPFSLALAFTALTHHAALGVGLPEVKAITLNGPSPPEPEPPADEQPASASIRMVRIPRIAPGPLLLCMICSLVGVRAASEWSERNCSAVRRGAMATSRGYLSRVRIEERVTA